MRPILHRHWSWAAAALLFFSLPLAAEDAGRDGRHASLVTGDASPALSRSDAERLIGRRVRGAERKEIGRVDDLLFDSHGTVRAAVVELDVFLGLAKRKIAVDRSAFSISADGTAVVLAMSPDQLKAAPTYVERKGEPIVGGDLQTGARLQGPPGAR